MSKEFFMLHIILHILFEGIFHNKLLKIGPYLTHLAFFFLVGCLCFVPLIKLFTFFSKFLQQQHMHDLNSCVSSKMLFHLFYSIQNSFLSCLCFWNGCIDQTIIMHDTMHNLNMFNIIFVIIYTIKNLTLKKILCNFQNFH